MAKFLTRSILQAAYRGLALCLAVTLSVQAHAEAGRVEFAVGAGTVRNAGGDRPLSSGLVLQSGDTVLTTSGRAQIRFTDGAYVSLQPNTEFAITDYAFSGKPDGTERGFFGLVKGAMRTVTGLIGRVNRDKYRVTTPTATIGIRGTGGVIAILLNGSTRIVGTHGVWTLTNAAGSLNIPAGRAGLATPDQSKPPQQTSELPQAPPAPGGFLPQVPIAPAENRTGTGDSVALGGAEGKPISIAYAQVFGGANNIEIGTLVPFADSMFSIDVTGSKGAAGEFKGFEVKETYAGQSTGFAYEFMGALRENGSDGVASWGRWTGPTTLTTTNADGSSSSSSIVYPDNGGFHFAVGAPATQMPTSGMFTYNMIGATAPTIQDASLPPGMVTSAQLTGTFTPAGGSVNMNMGFNFDSTTYVMSASGTISGTSISGSGNVTGGTCSATCFSSIEGGFSGAGATHVGVAYTADTNPGGSSKVGGAIVLRR